MRNSGLKAAGALLLGLSVMTAGCGRVVNRTVERRIREALPRTIGPAKEYRVHVASAMGHTLQGKLGDVTVDGDDVQLSNGMVLDSLNFDLKNVDVDVKHRQLREIQESRFRVVIRDSAVDDFLVGKSPRGETVRNAHVTFGEGSSLTLKAERVVDGQSVPFSATGSLKIRDPQHAGVELDKLSVTDTPITGAELELVQSKLENAIDLSRLPIKISLTHVGTSHGTLTLEGAADLTAAARNEWSRQK